MITDSKYCLFILVFLSSIVSAQQTKVDTISKYKMPKTSSWEGGLMLGATVYAGDMELALGETRPIVGVFVHRALGNKFAFQANLSQGILAGSDAYSTATKWRIARNISFKTALTELYIRGEFHFLGNFRQVSALSKGASVLDEASTLTPMLRTKQRKISPYIYVGGGLILINPKTNFNDSPSPNPITEAPRIAADKAATISKVHFTTPFGGGLRIPMVNNQSLITIEGGFRPTYFDYLDGVSIAGNPNKNDWYFVDSLCLSRILGYTKDSDKDGIVDKYDLCPFLKGDAKLQGCPDRDGDGVTDDKDACPGTAGLAIYEGCPDTDGDGIIDKYDDCPTEAGLGRYKGCPTEKKPVEAPKDSVLNAISTPLDTLKSKIEPQKDTSKTVEIAQIPSKSDSLTHTEQPIAVQTPPQYVTPAVIEKPVIAKPEHVATADTLVSTIRKPRETATVPKDTPQYVTPAVIEKPVAIAKPEHVATADTLVSTITKPRETATVPKDTPQYVTPTAIEKPVAIAKPERVATADTLVSTIKKPRETEIAPKKETPQYVSPTSNETPADMPKPTEIPESELKPYLEQATTTDTVDNAFNITRNHYTISPVYFDHSKAIFKPESFVILDEIAYILMDNRTYRLVIKGHTDSTGTKAGNLQLSTSRAKSCYLYLVRKGVPAKKISFKGFGQTQPVADNDTEEARQLNRRVEFEIVVD